MADKFYTSVGDILVAVNPFKGTVHFTPQEMHDYSHRGGREMAPHPYTIVDDAFRDLVERGMNQSVSSYFLKFTFISICLLQFNLFLDPYFW